MGNYSNLLLDASKIEGAVKSFPGCAKVVGPTVRGKFHEYEIHMAPDAQVALLHVYGRGDGLTTLQCKVGKNQEISAAVAEHVAEATKTEKRHSRPLALKHISEEHWKFLVDTLHEEGLTLEKQVHQNAERYSVLSSGDDVVYIHRYTTGRFLMQGRPHNAFNKVVDCLSYVSEEKKELISAQLETFEVNNVSTDALLAELEQRMPAACKYLNETVRFIFAPALALTKINIDLPDYSFMAYPALRGLEGCIKEIFLQHKVDIDRKKGLGEHFDSNGILQKPYPTSVVTAPTAGALESFYAIYNKHRNSLFHADKVTVSSRVVDSKAEADAIVNEIFFVVEKGFSTIP